MKSSMSLVVAEYIMQSHCPRLQIWYRGVGAFASGWLDIHIGCQRTKLDPLCMPVLQSRVAGRVSGDDHFKIQMFNFFEKVKTFCFESSSLVQPQRFIPFF
jgi:hypothetical protein